MVLVIRSKILRKEKSEEVLWRWWKLNISGGLSRFSISGGESGERGQLKMILMITPAEPIHFMNKETETPLI
jgi:hypothetical protein